MIPGVVAGQMPSDSGPWSLSILEANPPIVAKSLRTVILGINAPTHVLCGDGGAYRFKATSLTELDVASRNWVSVVNEAGDFYMFAPDGSETFVQTSADYGSSWSDGVSANAALNAVTSKFSFVIVGVGNGVCRRATRPDGVFTWSTESIPAGDYRHIAYSSSLDLYVATLASGTAYATSPDGITWTSRSMASYSFRTFAWNSSLNAFIGVEASALVVSADGLNWTRYDLSSIGNDFCTVQYYASQWVVVPRDISASPVIAVSPDLSTWSGVPVNVPVGAGANYSVSAVSGPTFALRTSELRLFGDSVLKLVYSA